METKHKLTFVSTRLPYPSDKDGNSENIFNLIKVLKEDYNYYISFYLMADKNEEEFDSFSIFVDELYVINPFSKYLFFIFPFLYKKIKISGLIYYSDFNAGYYSSIFIGKSQILYVADSPTYYYSKQSSFKSRVFYLKYIIEEKILFSKFNKVLFVSKKDLNFSKSRLKQNGSVVPIGFSYSDISMTSKKEFDLVFSGNFSYFPNRHAAEFFLNYYLEGILEMYPFIKILFVGRFPSEEMLKFSNQYPNNIFVPGEVINLLAYISRAKIYFSPLMYGSGMKNKILQAMYCRLPIVCSSESISGLEHYDNESIKVVREIDQLVSEISSLLGLTDEKLVQLGNKNFDFFMNYYTWNSIIKKHYLPLFDLHD